MTFLLLDTAGRELGRWVALHLSNAPYILSVGLRGITDPAMTDATRRAFLWGLGKDLRQPHQHGALTLRLAGEGE